MHLRVNHNGNPLTFNIESADLNDVQRMMGKVREGAARDILE